MALPDRIRYRSTGGEPPAWGHSSSTVRRRPRIMTSPTAMMTTRATTPRINGSDDDEVLGPGVRAEGAGVGAVAEPPGDEASTDGVGDGWADASVRSV
jgi:hypothetical protein